MMKIRFFRSVYLVPVLFFLLYLLFPVKSSTIDAYAYANYVRDGYNLFQPHHLLYSFFAWCWSSTWSWIPGMDILASLKVMNALFAALSLVVLSIIARQEGQKGWAGTAWVVWVGGSWAVMRFATENETYIVPIFFSMLASLFFLLVSRAGNAKHAWLSGFFAAFACLFHQIHFFWWLALLITLAIKKNYKMAARYALPALQVPLVYALVVFLYKGAPISIDSLVQFVFHDFYSGAASLTASSSSSFLFTGISFIRTFFQVHGYLFVPGSLTLFSWIVAFAGLGLALAAFFVAWKPRWSGTVARSSFVIAHGLAFAFHFLFAFLSRGNAEFMVMLPFLLALVLPRVLVIKTRAVVMLASGTSLWNIAIGLIPLNQKELDGNSMIARYLIEKHRKQDKIVLVLFNKPNVENHYRYEVGKHEMVFLPATSLDKPLNETGRQIMDALNRGDIVYTDVYDRPRTMSRETMVLKADAGVFDSFVHQKVDSVTTLTGKYYLSRITGAKE